MNAKLDKLVDRGDRMLVELAKAVFITQREVSVSLMQRHLRIGYRHALNIMAQLEQAGIVTELNADNVRTLTAEYVRVDNVTRGPP
ncbi:hypothetical protein HH213_14905 [Duganella dendranthematis]|uniref:FtsK gamma domain-containing protein n=1 Tax=Duganella dendranthematis TaxID=2728021 RepID=A0ABX6MEE6_9BURK|nr:DNA translocase FtsK [Duganella dendranthematis]QJD91247.1 hypothetical protein HH213_14905 [Duganella dendranthematis]